MTAIGTVLNMLVVVVRSAELASTSYLLGNYVNNSPILELAMLFTREFTKPRRQR